MNGISPIQAQALAGLPDFGQVAGASTLKHEANGATFSFKLPQAPAPVEVNAKAATDTNSNIIEPTNWGHMVQSMVLDVNQSQNTAGAMLRDVLAGGPTSVQDAMTSMQEASLKFQLLAGVRDRAIEAYQEVMRMQV